MEKAPVSLQEMLRRALTAQVELGMGEIIVKSERERSGNGHLQERIQMIRKSTETMDLFGADKKVEHIPQFESLEAHYKAICTCQLCPLGQTRTKFVYGVGSPEADLIFIGEAPGRDEDLQGEPFVGRAGQLLDRILAAMGLSREEVYIGNILKCRPPNNRDPLPDEAEKCLPHLLEQITLIRPKLICALGRVAGQILLKTTAPLGKLRGEWHEFEGVPLMVTYHPAALLRSPGYKKDLWADMQVLKKRLDELKMSQNT
jgi:uracil-DNA glycosylase family 4